MNRPAEGQLAKELRQRDSKQAREIAEIIQRVRPDVLLINEFDHDPAGVGVERFQRNYLSTSQRGQQPITFAYRYLGAVNTGQASGHDLDNDGRLGGPGDAIGFGRFPGQYGMLVLSRYPIDQEHARSFQKFLWRDMPDALLPTLKQGPFYSKQKLGVLRLSSKSHWDLPVRIGRRVVHFLCSHPTPPVFDGPEDRHGRRNHDEIRFWADYIDPSRSGYIKDDGGRSEGLPSITHFVIAGDMNADPHDGDSIPGAIDQLLSHDSINSSFIPASRGAITKSIRDGGANKKQRGLADHDTSDFGDDNVGNLRLDFVLPSKTLEIVDGGVFWPAEDETGHDLVEASDHRLVWIDVEF